jgi:hypothetical protein
MIGWRLANEHTKDGGVSFRPRFMLWPGDRVVALCDMQPDYGIYWTRGLCLPVALGTEGTVKDTTVFMDAVIYRVHWKLTSKQKHAGWLVHFGNHSPDEVGYLLRKR